MDETRIIVSEFWTVNDGHCSTIAIYSKGSQCVFQKANVNNKNGNTDGDLNLNEQFAQIDECILAYKMDQR